MPVAHSDADGRGEAPMRWKRPGSGLVQLPFAIEKKGGVPYVSAAALRQREHDRRRPGAFVGHGYPQVPLCYNPRRVSP